MKGRTISHIDTAQREIDDRRILLLDKVVLRESLDMKNEERRQSSNFESTKNPFRFLRSDSVVFREDCRDRNLRYDILFDDILEDWRRREIDREEEEWRAS